jgi:hypothetical protein
MFWKMIRLVGVAAVAAATTGTAVTDTRADDPPACPSSTDNAYTMTTRALTDDHGTDVELRVSAAPGCAAVDSLQKVQLKTYTEAGKVATVVNRNDNQVKAKDGLAVVSLDRVERERKIEADVLVHTATPDRTYVLRGTTTSRLRPDLVVKTVQVPQQTLTTRPVDVSVEVVEVSGDTGATATLSLASGVAAIPGVTPQAVTVPAKGSAWVTFKGVAFTTAADVDVTAAIGGDAAPAESDIENNAGSKKIDVTKDELERSRLVLDSLGGYGFQFNQHVYAPITLNAISTPPPKTLPDSADLTATVKDLKPQLVRIFYNDDFEERQANRVRNLQSFKDVVALANSAGATIDIDYAAVNVAKTQPDLSMKTFAANLADTVADLKLKQGHSNVHWVTVGNEPNSTQLTLAQYDALCRALDRELRTRGLRAEIGLIGGDLVENGPIGHRAWFNYMTTNMNDLFDAWAEHIYWQYDNPFRMEERLKDVAELVHQELPVDARDKPTFITEYGVRGTDSCGTKPKVTSAYYKDDACTEIRRMPLAGFHKLWFTIQSAQLGFDGAINWDLYWGKYNTSNDQSFWSVGLENNDQGGQDWVVYPSYNAMQMVLQTTGRGWQVLGVDPWNEDDVETRIDDPHPDQPEQELAAYQGPDGQMTVLGLDTNGRALTEPNGVSSSYSIGNLAPGTDFNLIVWNGSGDGQYALDRQVTVNANGVARFEVPLQAGFALTTVPVS